MNIKYSTYEKNIKKSHRFGWTPKYTSEFKTRLSLHEFLIVAERTFNELEWVLVYQDDQTIEAKRKESSLGIERWTEGISATFEHGKIVSGPQILEY